MRTSRKGKKEGIIRAEILAFAADHFGTEPEFPWIPRCDFIVLRRSDNHKWYGLIMDVPREKLGIPGQGMVDILDIKCDPYQIDALLRERGFLPAYHMHKGNWITVLLDGSVKKDKIFALLEESFALARKKQTRKPAKPSGKAEWIVPANSGYFDLEKAFAENETILWKQSSNIYPADIVYLYVAAPVSAVLYQCEAVETDLPYTFDDGKVRIRRVMKIRLLHTFAKDQLSFEKLKAYGITTIRGPRRVPNSLRYAINALIQ